MPEQDLYLWDAVAGKWVKAQAGSSGSILTEESHHAITDLRITATGLAVAGLVYLHWITVNPSGANSVVVFTNSLVALAPNFWAYTKAAKDSDHITFAPALKFTVGLYVETLANVTACNIAYDTI